MSKNHGVCYHVLHKSWFERPYWDSEVLFSDLDLPKENILHYYYTGQHEQHPREPSASSQPWKASPFNSAKCHKQVRSAVQVDSMSRTEGRPGFVRFCRSENNLWVNQSVKDSSWINKTTTIALTVEMDLVTHLTDRTLFAVPKSISLSHKNKSINVCRRTIAWSLFRSPPWSR